ncbi:hypothetical protein [Deferribacter desulfuricans]|uniref:hypothetical protein n=1 Tax=Deferribacter desulfuricans TaxID=197162 RepID=UPI00059E7EC2|nr:hypothetical protein [Deferribacter desulfuricans]
MKNKGKISCYSCKNFFITWDKMHPYGCKKIGFKSKVLPMFEVKKSSGIDCLYFTPKHKKI